ncbi:hypothetical protein LPN01_03120 [Sphingomonas sp. A2-49]|uniref:hypothetical protein n=1 Tax=Sphingomonas sp. A2-49 TaxID=1391375 RepID=UPI0021CF2B7A|nr:hypothetical protein [Sphingomonas sp. A2-49]MCU6453063.1 hypothetical protein [Sphingomonas sp. A2-49]
MATREQLYAKFGETAEAAQLFETELATLLLCVQGLEQGWHVAPDGEAAAKVLHDIDRSTLGQLLAKLRLSFSFDEAVTEQFASALSARNRLNHGFYERHNFAIQTDGGRDAMLAGLSALHDELFNAWRMADRISTAFHEAFLHARSEVTGGPTPAAGGTPRPEPQGAG